MKTIVASIISFLLGALSVWYLLGLFHADALLVNRLTMVQLLDAVQVGIESEEYEKVFLTLSSKLMDYEIESIKAESDNAIFSVTKEKVDLVLERQKEKDL